MNLKLPTIEESRDVLNVNLDMKEYLEMPMILSVSIHSINMPSQPLLNMSHSVNTISMRYLMMPPSSNVRNVLMDILFQEPIHV